MKIGGARHRDLAASMASAIYDSGQAIEVATG